MMRDRILDSAERLMGRLGYQKMTMDDIAREAGIGRRTIYLHFPGKEETGLATIDRIGVVHVMPEASELYDLGDIDVAFAEFRAAQVIYGSARRRELLVAAPVQVADAGALF